MSLGMSNPQPVAGCMRLRIAMDTVQRKMVSVFKMLGFFLFFIFCHIFGNWILRFSSKKLVSSMMSQC